MEQMAFRCEVVLKHEMEEIAKRQERTLTQVIRHACKEYVERQQQRNAA